MRRSRIFSFRNKGRKIWKEFLEKLMNKLFNKSKKEKEDLNNNNKILTESKEKPLRPGKELRKKSKSE